METLSKSTQKSQKGLSADQFESIPLPLRERTQWVCWRLESVEDEEKPRKIPHQPGNVTARASTTDPSHWATFEDATKAHEQHGFNGIGFVFSKDDPYCGVDLDKCRNPQTGVMDPWAQAFVDQLGSYSEVSQSGTGVHVIIEGITPGTRHKKKHETGVFEVYDHSRFFCTTGNHIPHTPTTINPAQHRLDAIYKKVFENERPTPRAGNGNGARPHGSSLDDPAVIAKAMTAKNGANFFSLWWNGDHAAYPSQSEADLALANHLNFYCGGDPVQMDRLFRQSRLYREKWDERHGAQTYGAMTIDTAIALGGPYYSGPRQANTNNTQSGQGKAKGETQDDEWPDPIPLEGKTLPPIPIETFPTWLKDMIAHVAAATETPPELAAMMGLATLATTAQRTFEIEPEPGYREPVNLWTIAAMDSGNRKTAVLIQMTAPLSDYEADQASIIEPEYKRKASERKTCESRIQHLRTKAAKCTDKEEFTKASAEIAKLEADLPVVPVVPQLWIQDVTPEKLAVVMAEQGGILSLVSDEGGLFETFAGRYSGGIPNLDLILKAHAGSPVRIHRQCREPIDMDAPTLTMGLSPQPEILRGLAETPGFRGRGLLARFLYVLPTSQLGARTLSPCPLPATTATAYSAGLQAILKIKPKGQAPRHCLQLTEDAHAEWKSFSLVVEHELREGQRFEYLRDWAGKLPGAAARVAGLLHIATHAHESNGPQGYCVSLVTMQTALGVMAVIAEHTIAAFGVMAANPDLEKAKRIWGWIQRRPEKTFTQRECHHGLQSTFPRVGDLKPGLDVLVERYLIRPKATDRREGRPSMSFEVNPAFLGEGA